MSNPRQVQSYRALSFSTTISMRSGGVVGKGTPLFDHYIGTGDSGTGNLLPKSTGMQGRRFSFFHGSGSAGTLVLQAAAGDTVNGGASLTLANGADHGVEIQCVGTNWAIVSQF